MNKKLYYFAVGPIISAIFSFITLPILSWYFTKDDIGRLAMYQVMMVLVPMLFSLGMDQSYVREYHNTQDKSILLKLCITPGLLLIALFSIVSIIINLNLSTILFSMSSIKLTILIFISIISSFLNKYLLSFLRMQENGILFSLGQILPKFLIFIFVISLIFLKNETSFLYLLLINTMASLFSTIILLFILHKSVIDAIKSNIIYGDIKVLLEYGIPLSLSSLAFWALSSIDKILLRSLSDYSELGVYSVAVSFAGVAILLQSVFSTVWSPIVFKAQNDIERIKLVKNGSRVIFFFVVFTFCIIGIFAKVVLIFLPESYKDVSAIMISCLGYPLLYTLSEANYIGINITRKSYLALIAAVISLCAGCMLNYILIPELGAKGAAISTMIGFYVLYILRTEFSNAVWFKIPKLYQYVFITICVIGASLSTLFYSIYYFYIVIFWLCLLISIVLIYANDLVIIFKKYKR